MDIIVIRHPHILSRFPRSIAAECVFSLAPTHNCVACVNDATGSATWRFILFALFMFTIKFIWFGDDVIVVCRVVLWLDVVTSALPGPGSYITCLRCACQSVHLRIIIAFGVNCESQKGVLNLLCLMSCVCTQRLSTLVHTCMCVRLWSRFTYQTKRI